MVVRHLVGLLLVVSFTLSDATSLTHYRSKRQAKCGSGMYKCTNGECIENFSVCDGNKDCKDGSDETQSVCSRLSLQCPSYAFRCAYGACIDKDLKCNGIQDCADNSDELLPECKAQFVALTNNCRAGEFQCTSGQCVDEFLLCDGASDCSDGSDETITQCINIKCPTYTFQCLYGACIEKDLACNNVRDCNDGSDEDEVLCKKGPAATTQRPPAKPVTTVVPMRPTRPRPPTRPTPTQKPIKGACLLPSKPEAGTYEVMGCNEGDKSRKCLKVKDTQVPPSTILTFSCFEGYTLSAHSDFVFCGNSTWKPTLPKCSKLCKPLLSASLDITCKYKGDNISCENPLPTGTKASVKCKPAYHVSDPSSSFTETVCLANGNWQSDLFRCVADCGKPNLNNVQQLISFGSNTTAGEAPWHAGLYLQENGKFVQACGASIISPHVLITAAHCVYIEGSEGKSRSPSDIKVAVGKYRRDWYLSDQYEQKRDVREVIIHTAYQGKTTSYAEDIALLDLVANIILNNIVLPACIDWQGEYSPPTGSPTMVVGWGLTETKLPSDTLQMANLPFIDYETCLREASKDFGKFITHDKICAGYKNGTGVQQGDSGGGLAIRNPSNHLYYLFGIVSVKPKDQDTFAAFTNIREHRNWLERSINALRPHHLQ